MFVLAANSVSTPLIAAARALDARALDAFAAANEAASRKAAQSRDTDTQANTSTTEQPEKQSPRERREELLSDPAIRAEIQRLIQRDREVKAHEQAHLSVGRDLITSGPNYDYATGPDERRYAIAGEVGIDTSPVTGDPEASVIKAQRIRDTALAPAQPSAQDRQVAAIATALEQEALAELARLQRESSYSRSGGRATEVAGLLLSIVV